MALPVVVASGKLAPVTTTISGGNAVSDIAIGTLAVAGAKVSELSAAIIAGNDGWQYGDQLTIVVLRQVGNYCRPQYVRIVLDREDSTLLSVFGTFSAVSGNLAFAITGDICVGFVHSNADGGMSLSKLQATQSMVTKINSYLSDTAFATASASYGESTEAFLVPAKGSTLVGLSGSNTGGTTGGTTGGNTGGNTGGTTGGNTGGTTGDNSGGTSGSGGTTGNPDENSGDDSDEIS